MGIGTQARGCLAGVFHQSRGAAPSQRHRGELKVLKQVSLLEHVSHPRHFVFILNAIRQAGDREA